MSCIQQLGTAIIFCVCCCMPLHDALLPVSPHVPGGKYRYMRTFTAFLRWHVAVIALRPLDAASHTALVIQRWEEGGFEVAGS